jgi:hypothetical protein
MVNTLLTSPMEISKKNDLLDNYPPAVSKLLAAATIGVNPFNSNF